MIENYIKKRYKINKTLNIFFIKFKILFYFHFIFPVIRFYIKNNFPFILNFRKLFIFINLNKLFWCKNTSILKY